MGIRKILDYGKKIKGFQYFFFPQAGYGNPDNKDIPTKENYNGDVSCVGPRSCYDESKGTETLCYIYAKYFNVSVM